MDEIIRMDGAECYRTVRDRMIELAAELTDEQARTPVPALPAWTVRDTYAHLAGVCVEALDGTLTGTATDEDTARQLRARTGRSLAELCDEWSEAGSLIQERLAGPKGYRYDLLVQDAWNHEQDVLGALGLEQRRGCPTTRTTAGILVSRYERGWAKHGLSPAVRLKTASDEWVIGVGEPVAELRTDDFELARILIGRRTLEEIRAEDWSGDPSEVVDLLHVFKVPEASLGERRG